MWLYKVIAFIGGFGFSSPKSGLKPRKGRGYAWNNWGNFQAATNMWRPETGPKNKCHKYVAAGIIGLKMSCDSLLKCILTIFFTR